MRSPTLLLLLPLVLPFVACGGSDDPPADAATTGGTSGTAGSGTAGTGGAAGKSGHGGQTGVSGGGQAGSGHAGMGQAGSGTAGVSGNGQAGGGGHAGQGQAGSGQAGSAQAGSGQAGSGQAGSGQAGSGQSGSAQAGSGQAGQGQAGQGQAGQGQAGQGQAGQGQAGAAGAGGGVCAAPVALVDTTTASATVGSGTPESCTEAALDAALAVGGTVVFQCGAAPFTLTVSGQKEIKKDTVLDGGGLVTLSGGGKTRILHVASAWDQVSPLVTVQQLSFVDGFTSDAPNTKETTQGGAAIFRDGGSLNVIDCQFSGNHCADTGQDVSGGAITSQGVGNTVVVGSRFSNNRGSNGGAIGNLGNGLTIVNSSFDGNSATGTDGNPGNGGNGGAVVFDGAKTTMEICGSTFSNNQSGSQGGAIFRVAYSAEPTTIDRCVFDANQSDLKVGLAGALYLQNTTIKMSATTLSGNRAHYGGGLWIGQSAVAQISNVTIANNVADQGGGVWVANGVTGTLLNCTLAGNTITPGGYAPGVFGGSPSLAFANTIFEGGGCKNKPLGSAGPNVQYPDTKAPCTDNVTLADPLLGTLQNNGGPTMTMAPGAGSSALHQGTNCPPTDQRGHARPATACTLGALEAD